MVNSSKTCSKLSIPLLVLLAICLLGLPAQGQYGGGSGTEADPYQIASKADLLELAGNTDDYSKYFILTADIDLAGEVFTAAVIAPDIDRFAGIFNGNGHTISNLTINAPTRHYIGLFGSVTGQIKNLGVENVNITGDENVGGLAGENGGTITSCYSTGSVNTNATCVGGLVGENGGVITSCHSSCTVNGFWQIGGLVGRNQSGCITSCYATGSTSGGNVGGLVGHLQSGNIMSCHSIGSVTGGSRAGGLVGFSYSGNITSCYSSSPVSGSTSIGGLVGENYENLAFCYSTGSVDGDNYVGGLVGKSTWPIISCYSTGSVSGEEYVGGLVGQSGDLITSCYSTGSVNGTSYVGGLVGGYGEAIYCYSVGSVSGVDNVGGLVGAGGASNFISCFWDIQTSGQTASIGGTGKTTAQMKMLSTFTDAGWNFSSVDGWALWTEGQSYPKLIWQPWRSATLSGSGTEADPYLIQSRADFDKFIDPANASLYWAGGKYTKLMSNLNLSDTIYTQTVIAQDAYNDDWSFWGDWSFQGIVFAGIFDGNGHTISNLTIDALTHDFVGLFGCVTGQVKNLGLKDIHVNGYDWVGGLAGTNYGIITSCYSTGLINGNCNDVSDKFMAPPETSVGGLVGENWGTITTCYSNGSVSGYDFVGGLVGHSCYGAISYCSTGGSVSGESEVGGLVGSNGGVGSSNAGSISFCYSTSSVVSDSFNAGGLVGENNTNGAVFSCYATGSVTGTQNIGGLVGENWDATITSCYATGSVTDGVRMGGLVGYFYKGNIISCYSTGPVNGWSSQVGGLVGKNYNGTLTACFWDTETSGKSASDGGTGKTTAEMQTQSTFTDAGWDFVGETANGTNDYWDILPENYPTLAWQVLSVQDSLQFKSSVYSVAENSGNVRVYVSRIGSASGTASISYTTADGTAIAGSDYTAKSGVLNWSSGNTADNFFDVSITSDSILENNEKFIVTLSSPSGASLGDPSQTTITIFERTVCSYGGGDGTCGNPYQIWTPQQMNTIGDRPADWSKHFKLMTNINMSGMQYKVIGTVGIPFIGIFDGNGHIISNLTIAALGQERIGLFGYVGSGGQIKNLGMENVHVIGDMYIGGLVGRNLGTITACYLTGSVSGTGPFIGGLVGTNRRGFGTDPGQSITSCYVMTLVSGTDSVGGLVGSNGDCIVTNCYATGSVSGNDSVGGLVGDNQYGTITSCYSTGSVSGAYDAGGLVGENDGEVTDSFWDIQTSGQSTSAGGTGKTTAEMQTMSTFTDAGWDFVDIWDLTCESMNYPRFIWQITPVDYLCPHGVDFKDYSFFADYWMDTNCGDANDCDGTDLDFSDTVDMADLKIFCDHWLEGVSN